MILMVACTVIPVHIAFEYEDQPWCIILGIVDLLFFSDLILSFFTSIPECEKHDEITDRRKIAMKYLKTWFPIDLLSIVPFHIILDTHDSYSKF
jgi:hypothetical protein